MKIFRFFQGKLYLPLFWKFSIAITVVVFVFGTINYSLIRQNFSKTLENELMHRLNFIINTISEQLTNSLLLDDFLSIQTIINTAKLNDTSINFILLFDNNGEIIAHSFEEELPEAVKQNYLCIDSCKAVPKFPVICKNEKLRVIQASKPILEGNLGYLFVGINSRDLDEEVNKNMKIFIAMILTFFSIGISGAFVFSHLITKPVKELDLYSQNFDLNAPNPTDSYVLDNISKTNHFLKKFIVHDEIDSLIHNFQRMVERLTEKHNQLQRMQAQLLEIEKMSTIGVLAAGLAHDINNPVAGILNSIHRLRKAPDNQEQMSRYLELMEESAKKIQFVIGNLMNFAKKQDIDFKRVKVVDVIERSLLLVYHRLKESKIKVRKKYNSVNSEIFGSSNHLEQVFINLMINSIEAIEQKFVEDKYLEEKEIEIIVSENSNILEVSINDNGIGIHQDKVKMVFEAFYTTKGSKGTGLGLSVVKNILNLHNAAIEIQSDYGKGTSVILKFNKDFKDEKI